MIYPTLDLTDGLAGMVHLRNRAGDSATISLYGAQLLSWKTADGQERLYCSPAERHQRQQPIRGGVPVCFPQFSQRGPLPKHGVVRTAIWQLERQADAASDAEDVAVARLSLSDSDASRALWPHHFLLQLQVELGSGWISIALNVSNTGSSTFDFTAALHTYLATGDVRQAGVAGLQNVTYIDTAHNNQEDTQSEALLRITEETDRIYLAPPAQLQLQQDGQLPLHIEQQGFCDSVVWNPGPVKAESLGDMPAADWLHMLCVEAVQVAQPVRLSPQATWRGVQRLSIS